MPTYEFECDCCGHVMEEFWHHPDDAPAELYCDQYEADGGGCLGVCRRRISAGGGVLFRGAGFHCNDYPKSAPPKEES